MARSTHVKLMIKKKSEFPCNQPPAEHTFFTTLSSSKTVKNLQRLRTTHVNAQGHDDSVCYSHWAERPQQKANRLFSINNSDSFWSRCLVFFTCTFFFLCIVCNFLVSNFNSSPFVKVFFFFLILNTIFQRVLIIAYAM